MNYQPLLAKFEDTALEIVSERGERFVTVRDLAAGLCAKKRSVQKLIGEMARQNVLTEGVHFRFIPLATRGGVQKTMIVSYAGVLKIVLRVKTPRAERFSDWCVNVLLGIMTPSVNGGLQRGGILEKELKSIGTASKNAMDRTCDLLRTLRSNEALVHAGTQPLKLLEGPTVTAMEWVRKYYPHYVHRRMNSGGRFERYVAERHLSQFGCWPDHRPTRRLNAWEYPEQRKKEFLEECLFGFYVRSRLQRSVGKRTQSGNKLRGV